MHQESDPKVEMQLSAPWQESNLQTCDSGAGLSYRETVVEL
jgi:hypothetical protein